MNSYDARRVTLDPGLTALALRGLRDPDGRHYPFVDQVLPRHRARSRRAARPAAHSTPRWGRAMQWWCGLWHRSSGAAL